jgi:hypothetical protein|tara:strand:+ start:56 stop:331 length:276 start_codon:yes stop_codon:yes gene_type:complete
MSRKITDQAVSAFYAGANLTKSNMFVTQKQMYLHGNMIAKIDNGDLFITTCGWNTPTTKERLNGLSGVRVNTKAYQLYLNGEPWNGDWIKV